MHHILECGSPFPLISISRCTRFCKLSTPRLRDLTSCRVTMETFAKSCITSPYIIVGQEVEACGTLMGKDALWLPRRRVHYVRVRAYLVSSVLRRWLIMLSNLTKTHLSSGFSATVHHLSVVLIDGKNVCFY